MFASDVQPLHTLYSSPPSMPVLCHAYVSGTMQQKAKRWHPRTSELMFTGADTLRMWVTFHARSCILSSRVDQVFKVGSDNSSRADVRSSNHQSTGAQSDSTGPSEMVIPQDRLRWTPSEMVSLGKGDGKDCGAGPLILVVHLVSVNEAGIMNPLNGTE